MFGAPKKIVNGPLIIGGGTYSNFFFPSWSPDVWTPGQAIDADNISPYWSLPTTPIPE